MSLVEEDPPIGVPEWVVTFGDMMSLLLTFFIMLVSLSEIKEEEKYQALVESVRKQFGYDSSVNNVVPGNAQPRDSKLAQVANAGRAKRRDLLKGGDKVPAPVGEHPRVRIVRPGSKIAIGAVIYFEDEQAELGQNQQQILREQIHLFRGKPQKIEIRGHTSLRPLSAASEHSDHWELAYQRCRNTVQMLVEELNIEPERLRISVAAANEPVHLGSDPLKLQQNPRVEVYLLDEVTSDLLGTEEEQRQRFSDPRDL